jgi:hypothetical protein
MFFVRGLSSHRQKVLINPDQVLYVRPAGLWGKKSALMLTHDKFLIVDQDTQTVRQRFEDYLNEVSAAEHSQHDDVNQDENSSDKTLQ